MKRAIATLTAAVLLLASTPAWAGGYGHRHRGHGYHEKSYGYHGYRGHRSYGHRSHGRRHGDDGALFAGVLAGGLVLGYLLTRPAYAAPAYRTQAAPAYRTQAAPAYYAPPRPVLGNCQATTGTGYHYGRPAQFGGTMCFDQYGRGYITPGSRYFIGYLR